MEVSLIDPQPFVQKKMDDENPTTKADQNVVVVVQNQHPSNLPIKVLIMVCTGSVLLVGGIIFIILFYFYFRNRRHRRGGINNRRESSSSSSSSSPDGANSRGLEPSVLRTLSDFRYSNRSNFGGGGGGMEPPAKECAVCLSGFEEGEMGRVLPNCKHSFHLQCIDIWFKFNSNCPLCRTQVAAVLPAVIIKNPDDHADVDVGLESGFCSVLNHAPPVSPREEEEEEEEDTVITCSTSAYQDKKPPAELTSIICS